MQGRFPWIITFNLFTCIRTSNTNFTTFSSFKFQTLYRYVLYQTILAFKCPHTLSQLNRELLKLCDLSGRKQLWLDSCATMETNLNHWVMHPVARVSTNICRNLRTQQMSCLRIFCITNHLKMATIRGRNM
jgi:hypothetical protein